MRKCSIENCNRKHHSKDYCKMHYKRYKKHGDPLIVKRNSHGFYRHPLYHIWGSMKQRCYNSNTEHFGYYGKRNIMVCGEWKNDPKNYFFNIK